MDPESIRQILAAIKSGAGDFYGQMSKDFGGAVMRVPEGGLRMLGMNEGADKIKSVREASEAEFGRPKGIPGIIGGMVGTVAPYALSGGVGPALAMGMPAEASSRDYSTLGAVSDWRNRRAAKEGRDLLPWEQDLDQAAAEPLARGMAAGGVGAAAGMLSDLLPNARRAAEEARAAARSTTPLPDIMLEADQMAIRKFIEARDHARRIR